ncbi:MAG TPA: hypothetical protein PKL31_08095 [Fulvivirga sp.]|nr:hypothetical protein [Fulvivirga sp.]
MKTKIQQLTKALSDYDSKALFAVIVLFSILVDYLAILYPVNDEVSLIGLIFNIENSSPFLLAINGVFTVLFYAMKFLIISESIRVVGSFFKIEINRKFILNLVILAECVYILAKVLELATGNLLIGTDLTNYQILSLNALLGSENYHSSTTFLLNQINVFPFMYAFFIGFFLMSVYKLSKPKAVKIISFSYGVLFIVYVLIRYIPISYLPQ